MKIWNYRDGQDSRVVDRGGWCTIKNISTNFPDRAGVYIFADSHLQVRYVGKAGGGLLKNEAMAATRRGKNRGATHATWLATNSSATALALEQKLIEKYNPPNNRT
jgi:excinuclease UvrABC nuclease subunit